MCGEKFAIPIISLYQHAILRAGLGWVRELACHGAHAWILLGGALTATSTHGGMHAGITSCTGCSLALMSGVAYNKHASLVLTHPRSQHQLPCSTLYIETPSSALCVLSRCAICPCVQSISKSRDSACAFAGWQGTHCHAAMSPSEAEHNQRSTHAASSLVQCEHQTCSSSLHIRTCSAYAPSHIVRWPYSCMRMQVARL